MDGPRGETGEVVLVVCGGLATTEGILMPKHREGESLSDHNRVNVTSPAGGEILAFVHDWRLRLWGVPLALTQLLYTTYLSYDINIMVGLMKWLIKVVIVQNSPRASK